MNTLTCNKCGRATQRTSQNQKYCPDCRVQVDRRVKYEWAVRNKARIRAKYLHSRKLADPRECVICGSRFQPHGRQVTCSKQCMKARRRMTENARRKASRSLRACATCGATFYPRGPQVTCSQDCRRERENARIRTKRSQNRAEWLSYMRNYNSEYRRRNQEKLAAAKRRDYARNRSHYLDYYKKWQEDNRRPHVDTREYQLRRLTAAAATRRGEPYGPHEDDLILNWGATDAELAFAIRRSLLGVQARRRYLLSGGGVVA